MSDFKDNRDLDGVKQVIWRNKIYDTGNSRLEDVELYQDGIFVRVVTIKSLKKVKQPTEESKMAKRITKRQAKPDKVKKKKYVLLEDIVIKAGTVFYDVAEMKFSNHYETSFVMHGDHIGDVLIEKDVLTISEGVFTELLE